MRSILWDGDVRVSQPFSTGDAAWAAGFYDGEGCLICRKPTIGTAGRRTTRRQLFLSIKQIAIEPLERFQRAVGGVGRIIGPYAAVNENSHPQWRYVCYRRADVNQILELLWPYLCSIKREQALGAFERYGLAGAA